MPEWVVLPEESGSKLISFLTKHLEHRYSSRFLKRALEHNRCRVNQHTERFASRLLGKGDVVFIDLTEFDSHSVDFQFEISRLLYEDEDFLIYNKPAGINSDEKGILSLLHSYSPHLRLIHRLDRETTGVLLLAKKESIFIKMVDQFKELSIKKSYLAIVDGIVRKKKGVIENYLGKKHHYEGQTLWGVVRQEKGIYAYTEWVKEAEGKAATLVRCFPKTGRTHQIRVHLASIGHPLLGDFQYCKQFQCTYRPDRYLLHAEQVDFKHPETKEFLSVRASLPDDFIKAQSILFPFQTGTLANVKA
jgi:RluA family pseudouridine synthase